MTNNDIEQRVDEILTTFGLHSIAAFRAKGAAIRQHDEAKQAILSLLTEAETRGRTSETEYWRKSGFLPLFDADKRLAKLSKLQEEQTHE